MQSSVKRNPDFKKSLSSFFCEAASPYEFYKKNIGLKIMTWMTNIVTEENHHKIKELFIAKNRDTAKNNHFPLQKRAI